MTDLQEEHGRPQIGAKRIAKAILAGIGAGIVVGASIAAIAQWRWGGIELSQVRSLMDRIVTAADRQGRKSDRSAQSGSG